MSVSSSVGLSSPSTSGMSSFVWVLDSVASYHMSPNSKFFVSLCPVSFTFVTTADGTPMPLAGVGSVVTSQLSLSNVYHIPKLTMNLVLVSQLCDSGSQYPLLLLLVMCRIYNPIS
ncbi:hypothetical protein ACOSQ3_028417 [Xanthoceras sorbifolium]